MQFRLRTLFILMAIVCVYCAVLNLPPPIAIPLFCSIGWISPAYWVTGVVYARGATRAFFIGGISGGAVPLVALVFVSIVMIFDGPWRWGRSMNGWGEQQLFNLLFSLLALAPVALAFASAWIAYAVYHSLQTTEAAVKSPIDAPLPTHEESAQLKSLQENA
ncbi:hypothetical protein NA78x_004655 [Anatilimnocola sp. NA78]|uniref:hypothetical protein n=1 Tax=Anatilimnocola sp. NA78 TaxID=3415683 RepID=UPI003CE501EB